MMASTIRLPQIIPREYCGDYCGKCPECRRLDRWLRRTTRGHRHEYPSSRPIERSVMGCALSELAGVPPLEVSDMYTRGHS
jgi:hypothetical protein